MKKYQKEFINSHKVYCTCFCVVMILMGFFAPVKSFILQWLIDSKNVNESLFYLAVGCIIFLCNFFFNLMGNNMFSKIQTASIKCIRDGLMNNIINRSIESKNDESIGNYISILTNDMQIMATDYYESLYNMVFYGIMLIISLFLYIYIDISMLLFVIIAGLSSVTIPRLLDKRLAEKRNEYSNSVGRFTSFSKEILYGHSIISHFLVGEIFQKKYEENTGDVASTDLNFNRLFNLSQGISSLISNLLFYMVLAFGMILVINNRISLGYMVAATNLSNFVIAPCQVISANYARYKASKKVSYKIEQELSKEKIEVDTNDSLTEFKKIEYANVSFKYGETEVLKNINLLWDNCKIAIVGESGSGKTTIIKILLNHYNNYTGKIYINDRPLESISKRNINKKIGYISQTSFIFNDTLKNNITLGEERFSDENVEYVIKLVGLDTYVQQLENGIYTVLEENGSNLSGGQIQRISIARVLIRNYKWIIADEITANLDVETKKQIMSVLLNQDINLIAITHDIHEKYMQDFDQIFKLSNGELNI